MKKKISVVSLGCAKNLVHSENMMGILNSNQYELTDAYEEAEIIIINTCGFITSAKEESINTILEMAQLKEDGCCETLVAIGCLVQKHVRELALEIPEIDLLLGTSNYQEIVGILERYYKNGQQRIIDVNQNWVEETKVVKRFVTTPKHYAYLRISEGCDNHCTYCVIPEMQGPYRSKPMENIVQEAQELVAQGYSELVLVAQDTTYYGMDLYKHFALAELLTQLVKIEDLKWVRILYAYPNNFTDELIDVIAKEDKICNYLDIPLQHADDQILGQMNRQITQAQMRALIDKLRTRIPGITLRSTFIVGFPGETEANFYTLISFLEDVALDRVGAFTYSQEEGTAAALMANQVDDELKETRAIELMDHQYDIMYANHLRDIGRELWVKVDEISEDVPGLLLCRSQHEAPEVDPFILVYNGEGHQTGDFLKVKIIGLDEYDFVGELINELA